MGKRKVVFERLNWDVECYYDIGSGNGFMITEPATFCFDDTKQKSLHGARSVLYGTSYEDEDSFMERHSCKCGEFKGRIFEGEICPLCNTKVEEREPNIEFTGWIGLGNGNMIINPYYYNRLEDCIGKTTLTEIVTTKLVVDIDGHMRLATAEELDIKPKHPFVGIGLIEFRTRFKEIIDYFKKKKKKKEEELDRLYKEASSVFCSHIPIYSTMLRPQSGTSDTYYYNTIDKHVNPLFSLSEKIKNAELIDKHYILGRIQQRVNCLWEENFNMINGKEGIIRGQILGGALNFTSRNVIIPDDTLHDDEVDVSYHTFRVVFKFKIIYYLMKMDDMNLAQAYFEWMNSDTFFNNRIYEIMQFIIKKEKTKILMNRNPTLNYYSMLLMRIRKVKKDFSDWTLSVPLSVCKRVKRTLNSSNCGELLIFIIRRIFINICSLGFNY